MAVRVILVTMAIAVASFGARAAQDPVQADAASMTRKLNTIVLRGAQPPSRTARAPMRTSFTDREVNAYFKVHGRDFMPEGIAEPQLMIAGGNEVHARAIVDVDAVRKSQNAGVMSPLTLLPAKVEVTAVARFRADNGMGTLTIESATIYGISVPISLLQMIVNQYTSGKDAKNGGFDLGKPFGLPSNIRSVETQPGAATVVQ